MQNINRTGTGWRRETDTDFPAVHFQMGTSGKWRIGGSVFQFLPLI
jgi:hypothetical protein